MTRRLSRSSSAAPPSSSWFVLHAARRRAGREPSVHERRVREPAARERELVGLKDAGNGQQHAAGGSRKTDPCRGDVLDALLQRDAAMHVRPERREQDQLALRRPDRDLLQRKLGLAARPRDVVQVPDGDHLALAERAGSRVDVPVVILPGQRALQVVADVLELVGGEERELERERVERRNELLREEAVDVAPVLAPADAQVGGALDLRRDLARLADAARRLLVGAGLEAPDRLRAHVGRQRALLLVDER